METREFEQFIRKAMAPENAVLKAPDPLLIFEARQAVLNRRKRIPLRTARWYSLLTGQLALLSPKHIGLALIIVTTGLLFFNQAGNDAADGGASAYEGMSVVTATNNTISVISSTMLTSIPTLRN